jgi:hypothetical protein
MLTSSHNFLSLIIGSIFNFYSVISIFVRDSEETTIKKRVAIFRYLLKSEVDDNFILILTGFYIYASENIEDVSPIIDYI